MERLTSAGVLRGSPRWQLATVVEIRAETSRARSYKLALPTWTPHLPGQHYDVRLTAPDGYQAQRSYSVASSPTDERTIELTIDRLADGEVSPYFHDVLAAGDSIEVRGPLTSYFTLRGDEPGPVLLVGGGSGVVPLMSMLRHNRRLGHPQELRLVYSVRRRAEVLFRDELGSETVVTYTRDPPTGWIGATGRVSSTLLGEAPCTAFVCGSHPFVDHVADLLLDKGVAAGAIRTERFGPSA